MKRHNKLDVFDFNLIERKCLKNKNLKVCQTNKCFTYNWYYNQNFPCPYYIPSNNERGFSENLHNINGIKIRRLYFNFCIYFFLLNSVIITISDAFVAKSFISFVQFIFVILKYTLIIILPFLILSFLNKRFFGRLVCIINETGLYCNQKLLRWEQIKRVSYDISIASQTKMGHCSVLIEYDKGLNLRIPYAPRSILKKIKIHCPNIKIGLNFSSKVAIVFSAVVFLMILIIINLIQTH